MSNAAGVEHAITRIRIAAELRAITVRYLTEHSHTLDVGSTYTRATVAARQQSQLHDCGCNLQSGIELVFMDSDRAAASKNNTLPLRDLYRTRDDARADVFDYIERFYNAIRRHSTIGYLSPVEFEKKAELA